MTVHVTITLDDERLGLARHEAARLGVSVETYLSEVVRGGLPAPPPTGAAKPDISVIFGIGESDEPTDIGANKDAMVSEAVWKEHLRKTRQSA